MRKGKSKERKTGKTGLSENWANPVFPEAQQFQLSAAWQLQAQVQAERTRRREEAPSASTGHFLFSECLSSESSSIQANLEGPRHSLKVLPGKDSQHWPLYPCPHFTMAFDHI